MGRNGGGAFSRLTRTVSALRNERNCRRSLFAVVRGGGEKKEKRKRRFPSFFRHNFIPGASSRTAGYRDSLAKGKSAFCLPLFS
ncbi:hypothetical protein PUN28_012236 [Cardiocondyla obscurior]|uniref:Uncharacterized protein n=1 Tax=Cardiocondyla obscurior TaxID=286306 RepID=A0AAW2FE44_9HYME